MARWTCHRHFVGYEELDSPTACRHPCQVSGIMMMLINDDDADNRDVNDDDVDVVDDIVDNLMMMFMSTFPYLPPPPVNSLALLVTMSFHPNVWTEHSACSNVGVVWRILGKTKEITMENNGVKILRLGRGVGVLVWYYYGLLLLLSLFSWGGLYPRVIHVVRLSSLVSKSGGGHG